MELTDVLGEHLIRSFMRLDLPEMRDVAVRDGPLGTVTITESTITCPAGHFTILGIRTDDPSGLWLKLGELPDGEACSIVRGGPYEPGRFGLMFHSERGHDTYSFDVADRPHAP